MIARTTSPKFIPDSQRKYFVSVVLEFVPRNKYVLNKRCQIEYVTRAMNKR